MSPNVGVGHCKRCEAIAAELKGKYEVVYRPIVFSKSEDFEFENGLVLLDTHQDVFAFISKLKEKKFKVIVLDNFNFDLRDLGINIFDHHPVDRKKTVTDLDHIVLRKEIFAYITSENPNGEYAIVSIGGGDHLRMGHQIAEHLRKFYNKKIILIQGPNAGTVELSINNFETLRSPANFLELLSRAEIVLCNAGTTLFEALLLKKRCIVFPQTQYEINIANYFYTNRYLLGIGIDNIASSLEHMTSLKIGPLPYSGKGAEAISKFIKGLL